MWLKQSTVQVINFGPVVDFGDGVTLETGAGIITSLDNATTGIMLSKNGGTLAVREQGANFVATTYNAHGCYKVSLSVIDTGTLGSLRVIHTEPATYLAVWADFIIVPANVWNSLVLGTDYLDVTTAGAGAISWPITITSSGIVQDGAEVWVTTDLAGTDTIASGTTDASGIVTFLLDAGGYYCWVRKSGVNFTNPTNFTVV